MLYKRTLRWAEPYGGWEDSDTGLCNRLFHWEVAYDINRRNRCEFRILLNKTDWPELALISLPETSAFLSYEYDKKAKDLNFLTVLDVENFNVRMASKIDVARLNYMYQFGGSFLDEDNHWYCDFGYQHINELYKEKIERRPIKYIRLRDQFIEDLLRRNTYDVIGIHIRRNGGVECTEDDILKMPIEIRKDFIKLKKKKSKVNKNYTFIDDTKYYNIIDNILKINPNQKFYLSADLPYEFFSYYKEKYGDSIITRFDLLPIVNEYLINSEINVNNLVKGNVIENIIDLFSLSYCKFLIKSDESTWSEFAECYRGQPAVSANDDWETIIKPKYENPNWTQPDGYYFGHENLDYPTLSKITPENL